MSTSDLTAFLAGVTAGMTAVVLFLEWSAGRARKRSQADLARGLHYLNDPKNVVVIPNSFRAEDWSA